MRRAAKTFAEVAIWGFGASVTFWISVYAILTVSGRI